MEYTPAYTPELSNTDRFSQKPTIIGPGSPTRASVPQGMPPQQRETVWEDPHAAYNPSKDGTLPQHDGSHEMSATLKAPLSLPTVDRE